MKTNDALGTVVGTSHRRIARVDLYDGADTLVKADLPITDGTVVGRTNAGDRWTASITLAGDLWVPDLPTDPLSGLSRHHLRIFMGAEVSTVDEVIEVCRVIPIETRVRRAVESVTVDVTCIGPEGYVAQAADGTFIPLAGETAQQMIERIVTDAAPPGWNGSVVDSSTAYDIPLGYYAKDTSPSAVIRDLVSMANITIYFDGQGNLVMRNPLSQTASPVRTVSVGESISTLERATGRGGNFSNAVELTYDPVGGGRGSFTAGYTYQVSASAPTSGQFNASGSNPYVLRAAHQDSSGFNRFDQLEKIERGDLLEIRGTNGNVWLHEVEGITDVGTYHQIDTVAINGSPPAASSSMEITAYARLVDPVIGTAEWADAPLRPQDAGKVVYRETLTGKPTQAQADARAQSILESRVRAWQTFFVDVIPDPRLEPDDDIQLVTTDATLDARITTVDLPMSPNNLMRLGVRTVLEGV